MARQEDQSRNGGVMNRMGLPPKWSENTYRTDCLRPGCGHSSDWHRLDDASNKGPSDPGAEFRCLGFDPGTVGSPVRRCDCPDMVR